MITDILLGYIVISCIGSIVYIVYFQIFKALPEQRLFFDNTVTDLLILPLGLLASTIAWPYFVYAAITHKAHTKHEEFSLKFKDLDYETNVNEIEKKHFVFDPLMSVPEVPFGHINQRWVIFKNSIENEDRMYSFKKTHKGYGHEEIKKGYAIIDSRDIVKQFFVYERFYVDELKG